MLEHGADLDGELLSALATLFQAVANDAFRVLGAGFLTDARKIIDPATAHAAMRADDSIGPHDAFKERESLGFVVEVGG